MLELKNLGQIPISPVLSFVNWNKCLTSLCLRFLIRKVRIITVLFRGAVVKDLEHQLHTTNAK